MSLLRGSRYNVQVQLLRGRSLLYNSLSRSMCLLERDETENFKRAAVEGVSAETADADACLGELANQGFLLPEEVDELSVVRRLYEEGRYNSSAVTLTICPTLWCNFGCDYCFQGKAKPKSVMSEDVQDGICDLFTRVLTENPSLNLVQFMWYGGEPLIQKKIIFTLSERLIRIARERKLDYTASMITNGYLLSKDVAQTLYSLGLRRVQVTLDGAKDYHDTRRVLLSTRGTFDRIVDNMLEWIDICPIHVDLRVNIDERNKDGIEKLIDSLAAAGLSHKDNFKMYFAPVESVTRGCHNVASKMMTKAQYGGLEARLYRYAFSKGLADLPFPAYFIGICSALRSNDYIVVPCGSVHKCWDTVSFADRKIGSVFELERLFRKESPQHAKWESFDPFNHETCRSCKLLPNCAGFCAHKFVQATETKGEASLPCPSLKYSLNEKLVFRAESEGHLSSDDYDLEMIRTDPSSLCSEEFDKQKYIDLSAATG